MEIDHLQEHESENEVEEEFNEENEYEVNFLSARSKRIYR